MLKDSLLLVVPKGKIRSRTYWPFSTTKFFSNMNKMVLKDVRFIAWGATGGSPRPSVPDILVSRDVVLRVERLVERRKAK